MKPEEQRIAIAEYCGWKRCKLSGGNIAFERPNEAGSYVLLRDIPNYPADLNAMHEAEKSLRGMQWYSYEWALSDVCGGGPIEGVGEELLHATSAQRAEAFLRAIGKWTE